MSHRIDDRWLWLGAGVALILTFQGISYAIKDTVRLTQVKPIGKDQDEELQRQPEDSIPVDVLRTLVDSPNPNISKCATDLILARCVKAPGLISEVQADAASSNPELRRKARTALRLLGSWSLASVGDPVPAGMRTGGSTGALNLSPSMLSMDSAFEFDHGISLPPRMGAQHYDRGGVFGTTDDDDANVWTTVARDDDGEFETDARRRQRHRQAVVIHGGTEEQGEDEIIRPRLA